MTKENVKIPENPMVARLMATGTATARTLYGYVGSSRSEEYVTLYPSLRNLTTSMEIARADILEFMELTAPGQPVILWVKNDAQIAIRRVATMGSAEGGRLQMQLGAGLFEPVENCHSNCNAGNCHSNCRMVMEPVENCHSNCNAGNCHSNCRMVMEPVENCHSNCNAGNCHSNCRMVMEPVENCHSNCNAGNCHSNCKLE
jgi:hypothetical protein